MQASVTVTSVFRTFQFSNITDVDLNLAYMTILKLTQHYIFVSKMALSFKITYTARMPSRISVTVE